MGLTTSDRSTHIADFILNTSVDKNRFFSHLADIDRAIDGSCAEAILTIHDAVGTGMQGAVADPPVPLCDGLLGLRGE